MTAFAIAKGAGVWILAAVFVAWVWHRIAGDQPDTPDPDVEDTTDTVGAQVISLNGHRALRPRDDIDGIAAARSAHPSGLDRDPVAEAGHRVFQLFDPKDTAS